MALTPDRQGYLGNLESKTLPQLKELLERQEKVLSDRKLISILPDKGKKVQQFADRLQQIINDRTTMTKVKVFKPTEKSAERQSSDATTFNVSDKSDQKTLEALVTRNEEHSILLQHGDEQSEMSKGRPPDREDMGELSSHLQGMNIGSRLSGAAVPLNSYERVIKKAAESNNASQEKYLPSRSLKYPVEESPSLHPSHKQETNKKKVRPVEESAVNPPPYAHQSSKLISIEESVALTEKQRKITENLIAERAAQRLADQLGPKMDTYSPAKTDMQYRVAQKENVDEPYDSDDLPSDDDDDDDDND